MHGPVISIARNANAVILIYTFCSLVDGQLEFMIQRRLHADDDRGTNKRSRSPNINPESPNSNLVPNIWLALILNRFL